ncbi:MAG: ABC transporter permease subunit [Planctomycetaceae bacterium]|nr:ABC transporter permease subunit [Planctomycetaceae bacterium]
MFLGPIFAADVISSGRRSRYYLIRIAYALLVAMVLALCYAPAWSSGPATIRSTAALAAAFFSGFAALQISAVLVLGPAFTAGAIATERERRTIEYLFATDLSNVEIVYGKFAAALLRMVVLLLVSLPILALARLLGGIAADRMLCVFAVTASTAVTVTALAIAVSVWTPRARDAVIRTYLLLFGLLVLPLLVRSLVRVLAGLSGMALSAWGYPLELADRALGLIGAGNPYPALLAILAQDFRVVPSSASPWTVVGNLVLAQGVVALMCLILAPWGVRRVHLRAAGGAKARLPRPGATSPTSATAAPAPAIAAASAGPEVWQNAPMIWKELFTERAQSRLGLVGKIVATLAALVILGATVVAFVIYWNATNTDADVAFQAFCAVMATLVICGSLLLLAARGATSITSEREKDTWTALLGTPLEASEIVLAKFWGTLYAGRWMLVLLAFLWLLGGIVYPLLLLSLPALLVSIAVLSAFFAALGVAFSLYSPNSTRALGATLAVCIVLGGGYFFCCGCLMVPLELGGGPGPLGDLLGGLMLAPWPPFLTFTAHFAGNLFDLDMRSDFSEGAEFIATWVVGNLIYALGAVTALALSIAEFNRLTGRSEPRTEPAEGVGRENLPAAEIPLVAELVDPAQKPQAPPDEPASAGD